MGSGEPQYQMGGVMDQYLPGFQAQANAPTSPYQMGGALNQFLPGYQQGANAMAPASPVATPAAPPAPGPGGVPGMGMNPMMMQLLLNMLRQRRSGQQNFMRR